VQARCYPAPIEEPIGGYRKGDLYVANSAVTRNGDTRFGCCLAPRDRGFESISLQRRICEPLVPLWSTRDRTFESGLLQR
jgi:hypothetical protein